MFERFTVAARQIIVQAQLDARRLGHDYIGCEHLLMAAAATGEPASAVLREQGVTPERIEDAIARVIGPGHAADPLGGLDREALAAIGIDLDVVRSRIEAAFGPDALTRAVLARKHAAQACRRSRRPAWGRGPVARLMRHRRLPRARRGDSAVLAPRARAARFADPPARGGHIPVYAARQEEPRALPTRGGGHEGQLHRRPPPRPGPAHHEGRNGAGDPGGPRRVGRIAACRHPRPPPQGELTPVLPACCGARPMGPPGRPARHQRGAPRSLTCPAAADERLCRRRHGRLTRAVTAEGPSIRKLG